MMADSGVTPDGLKASLKEKVQATYVEIEDMSGKSSYCRFQCPQRRWSYVHHFLRPALPTSIASSSASSSSSSPSPTPRPHPFLPTIPPTSPHPSPPTPLTPPAHLVPAADTNPPGQPQAAAARPSPHSSCRHPSRRRRRWRGTGS